MKSPYRQSSWTFTVFPRPHCRGRACGANRPGRFRLVPDGVPEERLDRLNKAVRKVVDMPEFASRLADMGARAGSSTTQGMAQLLTQQRQAWEALAAKHPEMMQK